MKNEAGHLLLLLLMAFNVEGQIPNNDFEFWSLVGWHDEPIGWTTNNPQIPCSLVSEDTIAYHGVYAMKLENVDNCQAIARTKFSITNHPLNLIAFQKCSLADSDTVSIRITILLNGIEVDNGYWMSTVSVGNYIQINIPISQNSTLADTALIEVKGGNRIENFQGSQLTIDYLFFDSVPNGADTINERNGTTELFPNPTEGNVTIDFNYKIESTISMKLYDILGNEIKTICENKLSGPHVKFDVSYLCPGLYYLLLKTDGYIAIKKILKI
jgi:hypothetical protein